MFLRDQKGKRKQSTMNLKGVNRPPLLQCAHFLHSLFGRLGPGENRGGGQERGTRQGEEAMEGQGMGLVLQFGGRGGRMSASNHSPPIPARQPSLFEDCKWWESSPWENNKCPAALAWRTWSQSGWEGPHSVFPSAEIQWNLFEEVSYRQYTCISSSCFSPGLK